MKVTNRGSDVVHIVLASGPVDLHKGESVEMPEWVYNTLSRVFPALAAETVIEAAPAPIAPAKPKPAEAKNVKGKKPRK